MDMIPMPLIPANEAKGIPHSMFSRTYGVPWVASTQKNQII